MHDANYEAHRTCGQAKSVNNAHANLVTHLSRSSFQLARLFGKYTYNHACCKNNVRAQQAVMQVGDWGRDGTQNQSAVAALMATVADAVKPDFILSMGDNFYESRALAHMNPCL